MTGLTFMATVAPDVLLGYIRIVEIGDNNIATEKNMDTLTALKIAEITQATLKTYYKIGEYWHIVI